METFNNGALRSETKPRYADISYSLLRRGALAFAEGYEKYEGPNSPNPMPVGYKNYKKGDAAFALEAVNHALEHLLEYKEQCIDALLGDEDSFDGEDHLGHLLANLVMLDFYETKGVFSPRPEAIPITQEELVPVEVKPTLKDALKELFHLS